MFISQRNVHLNVKEKKNLIALCVTSISLKVDVMHKKIFKIILIIQDTLMNGNITFDLMHQFCVNLMHLC